MRVQQQRRERKPTKKVRGHFTVEICHLVIAGQALPALAQAACSGKPGASHALRCGRLQVSVDTLWMGHVLIVVIT
jgi:hypothetical protein